MAEPIGYAYEVDGHAVTIERRDAGTAYPRNGNVHNPTRYYRWTAAVDGRRVATAQPTRRDAYEVAVMHIRKAPGRQWWVTQAEMRTTRVKHTEAAS